MKFKLRKVVDFAYAHNLVTPEVIEDFFGGPPPFAPGEEWFDESSSLFNEWLIFEYQLSTDTNIIGDYYLKNPENLKQVELKELKAVVETQIYEWVELISKKERQWIKVYGLLTGKTYTVYDVAASVNLPDRGSYNTRLAKIGNRWYAVGCDPLVMPVTYTKRSRQLYRFKPGEKTRLSCKDTLQLMLPKGEKEQMFFTKKEIKAKQKMLGEKYQKISQKLNIKVSFTTVLEFIYNENYQTNFTDWQKDISVLGFEFDFISDNLKLFENIWNFYPHKRLGGKSPAQMYTEIYGKL